MTGTCREPSRKVEGCIRYSSNGVCERCVFGQRPIDDGRECFNTKYSDCAHYDPRTGECLYCSRGILIDSEGNCDQENRCRITGCSYCYLDEDNN